MKKQERILENINMDKEIMNYIKKENYHNLEDFYNDASRYILAIKEGRMVNSIGSVAGSGMSRTIRFLSCEKRKVGGYGYMSYFSFFSALGYKAGGKYGDYFRVNGCGMDMIFDTNYNIIHRLKGLGFINEKQCKVLSQMTPNTI